MDCHDEMSHVQKTERICALNDRLRITGEGGLTMLTPAVAALSAGTQTAIMRAIRTFSGFNPANDPWQEHDFGQVEVDGQSYFWRIDAYDLNLEFGSVDPADEAVTARVLTIMLAPDL